jgi:hypothetical protein
MNAISQERLDTLILSFARDEWRKVAMIISRVYFELEGKGSEIDLQEVADRIVALVEAGKLEAQGDLCRWRHSEVRLPG